MLPLWHALGVPSTRVPLDLTAWVSYVHPPLVLGSVIGLLAIIPQTRSARLALWPIVALLALRAAVGVDMTFGKPGLKFFNAYFAVSDFLRKLLQVSFGRRTYTDFPQCIMFSTVARALDFALAKEPLMRRFRPASSVPSIIKDALDLSISARGLGWNWSHGLHIPQDARPTNRMPFAFCTVLSAAWYAFVFGVLHRAILSFSGVPPNPQGSTIFDETLPPSLGYFRASIISILTALVAYSSLQMTYDLSTISAVLFFGQDPAEWPPAFDAPWRATSLVEFWGRRWHQLNRHVYLVLGGRPFTLFFGRAGTILGAFLTSAVMHDILLLCLDRNAEPWRMFVGFGMMGPAMLAERAFYKATGRKVGGMVGWVWMMAWMVVLGNGMIEGVIKAGGLGSATLIDGVTPVRVLVERLVTGFDGWLHAI